MEFEGIVYPDVNCGSSRECDDCPVGSQPSRRARQVLLQVLKHESGQPMPSEADAISAASEILRNPVHEVLALSVDDTEAAIQAVQVAIPRVLSGDCVRQSR